MGANRTHLELTVLAGGAEKAPSVGWNGERYPIRLLQDAPNKLAFELLAFEGAITPETLPKILALLAKLSQVPEAVLDELPLGKLMEFIGFYKALSTNGSVDGAQAASPALSVSPTSTPVSPAFTTGDTKTSST